MGSLIQPATQENITYAATKRMRILLKTRLDSMDSMIANPTENELDASMLDAIDSFNLQAPQTSLTLSDVVNLCNGGDTNLDHLVLIGSCYHITKTIWSSWGHTGQEINLSILSEKDRFNEFEQIMNSFRDEFDNLVKEMKNMSNLRLSKASFSSTSRSIGYGRGRGNRRGFKSNYRSC